jgi:hypothetical protein
MFHNYFHHGVALEVFKPKQCPIPATSRFFFLCKSAGHRKPVANGVDIAAFNHALFFAYISVDQCFMIF